MDSLNILSANVRGLRTNLGDLTHTALRSKASIIICCETFLDENVPPTYGKIQGYTHWYRKDRQNAGGGVAVCHKEGLHIQPLHTDIPEHFEIMCFKLFINSNEKMLIIACYRPQWQGNAPIEYLNENLDTLLLESGCSNVLIAGDLNQHLIQRSFDDLLLVHDLHNHVDFPTHISGSSLDPVLTDFPNLLMKCEPLSYVGTSDHNAVLTCFDLQTIKEKQQDKTIWLWQQADWEGLRQELRNVNWGSTLSGTIDQQVQNTTDIMLRIQKKYVPSRAFSTGSSDQPWFGYRCRLAADRKYKSWKTYKQHQSQRNKNLHRLACRHLNNTIAWAKRRWQADVKKKLREGRMGTKQWWSTVKEQQGLANDDLIPPLTLSDGTVSFKRKDKAEALAQHFSSKMKVPQPHKETPQLIRRTEASLNTIYTDVKKVKALLSSLDTTKAVGPDGISPLLLRNCNAELAPVFTKIFNTCLHQSYWPQLWKSARVVPVHKKGKKTCPKNYRPISLLPVPAKVFEEILVENMNKHIDKYHLLSLRQFGFRKGKSASDLLLLLDNEWSQKMDTGEETRVVALDIAGAFDTVWHSGLITRLQSIGIEGDLLLLLENYLADRSLSVVLQGEESNLYPISAGVPQGSLLGPLLWNIFFDEVLHLSPSAVAYADDLTLTKSYKREQRSETTQLLQQEINNIALWGRTWQVKFAAEKSQSLTISRMKDQRNNKNLIMDGDTIQPVNCLTILGVHFDNLLTYEKHIKHIARIASMKLGYLRRISHLLTPETIQSLYYSQIRSSMEYAALSWGGAARTHLDILDKVQRRAHKLATNSRTANQELPRMDTLQHRRDVGGLTVFYKANVKEIDHLAPLVLPPQTPTYLTRTVEASQGEAVVVPRPHTSHYQRAFLYKYSTIWNELCCNINIKNVPTVQRFKENVNTYLLLRCFLDVN